MSNVKCKDFFIWIHRATKDYKKDGVKDWKGMDNIISMIKKTDPLELPSFVSSVLQKLPPITFDHIDVIKLLKDLLLMENEI